MDKWVIGRKKTYTTERHFKFGHFSKLVLEKSVRSIAMAGIPTYQSIVVIDTSH